MSNVLRTFYAEYISLHEESHNKSMHVVEDTSILEYTTEWRGKDINPYKHIYRLGYQITDIVKRCDSILFTPALGERLPRFFHVFFDTSIAMGARRAVCRSATGDDGLPGLSSATADLVGKVQYRLRTHKMDPRLITCLVARSYMRNRICGGGVWIYADHFSDVRAVITMVVGVWSWKKWRLWVMRGILHNTTRSFYSMLAYTADWQLSKPHYCYVRFPRLVAAMLLWQHQFFVSRRQRCHGLIDRTMQRAGIRYRASELLGNVEWRICNLVSLCSHYFLEVRYPLANRCFIIHPYSTQAVYLNTHPLPVVLWPVSTTYTRFGLEEHFDALLRGLGLDEQALATFDLMVEQDLGDDTLTMLELSYL